MARPLLPVWREDTLKLSELARDCLMHLDAKGRAASTLTVYDHVYRQFHAYLVGRGLLDDVRAFTEDTVIGFASALRANGADPNTIRKDVSALATLARFGLRIRDSRGRPALAADPTKAFERPPRKRPDKKFLYAAELQAFLALARPLRESVVRDVLLNTGIRNNELCHLDTQDLLDAGPAYLAIIAKGGHRAYVPVSPDVVEAIRESLLQRNLPGPREPLFVTSRGERFNRSSLYALIERMGRAAGITRFAVGPHTLRHTANVVGRVAGIDPYVRSRLLTHMSPRTLAEYEHILPGELHEARRRQWEAMATYAGILRRDSSTVSPPQP